MSVRYRIIFAAFPDFEKKGTEIVSSQQEAAYDVCTLKGEAKAITMATSAHCRKESSWQIFDASVQRLEGNEPQGRDLVDRMEW